MLTPQQRKDRKLGIGGSDVAAILGVSPYKTALDVWHDKTRTDDVEEEVDNDPDSPKNRGNREEKAILSWYEFWKNRPGCLTFPNTLVHLEYPFLRANLDAHAHPNIVVEAKSVSWSKRGVWGEEGTDAMPAEVLCQVAFYCAVCNAPEAHVVVKWHFDKTNEWRSAPHSTYIYKRDMELEQFIIDACCNFWHDHVLAGVAPEPRTPGDVVTLWPRATQASSIECPDDLYKATQDLIEIRAQIKKLEESSSAIETAIKTHMKDNEILSHNGKILCTWKNQKRSNLDVERLYKEETDIYNRFIKQTQTRTFRITSKI